MTRRLNGQTIMRERRRNGRSRELVRTTDPRDMGNRPGLARLFEFTDPRTGETETHNVTACDVFGCEVCAVAS